MGENEYEDLKEDLLRTFSREYIYNLGCCLYELAQNFLSNYGLVDEVVIEKKDFFFCVIDVLIDIMRLRSFHDIEDVSLIKFRAYSAAWWIRRKPFKYKNSGTDCDVWINERFALSIMLQALDKNLYTSESYDRQKVIEVTRLSFYYLKYRDVNPKALELFLVGLNTAK